MKTLKEQIDSLYLDDETKELISTYAALVEKMPVDCQASPSFKTNTNAIAHANGLCIDSSYIMSILKNIKAPSDELDKTREELIGSFYELDIQINEIYSNLYTYYYDEKGYRRNKVNASQTDEVYLNAVLNEFTFKSKENTSDLTSMFDAVLKSSEHHGSLKSYHIFMTDLMDKANTIINLIESKKYSNVETSKKVESLFFRYTSAFEFIIQAFFDNKMNLGTTPETLTFYHLLKNNYCLVKAVACTQLALHRVPKTLDTTPIISKPLISSSSSTQTTDAPPRTQSAAPETSSMRTQYQDIQSTSGAPTCSSSSDIGGTPVSRLSLLRQTRQLPPSTLRQTAFKPT